MLRGLRDHYLHSIGGPTWETALVREVLKVHHMNSNDTSTYKSTFEIIQRLISPNMNNIYNSVGIHNLRSNLIYTSHPETYFNDLIDFYLRSLFPETSPWLRKRFVGPNGLPIDQSKLDIRTVQFGDDFINLKRYWLRASGFYEAAKDFLWGYFTIGNAAMQALQSLNEFNVINVPIARLAVILDSAGRVAGCGEIFAYEDWEVRKLYGDGALGLFSKDVRTPQHYVNGNPWGFSQSTALGTEGLLNSVGAPRTGFQESRIKQVLKLFVPNRPWMDIPHSNDFYPEMGYICYNIALKTNRLLDVEVFPEFPFGIAMDSRPQGEKYGRGLGHRVFADCSVLNEKKAIELQGIGLAAQPPAIVKGKGFKGQQRNSIRPNEVLNVHNDTEVTVLSDYARFYTQNRSSYEEELLFLREAAGRDRMEIQLQDRMTADEYNRRQDVAWSLNLPTAGRIYKGVEPVLNNLASWLFVTGKMPEIPGAIADGVVRFEVVPYSVFSYGQDSELGQNLLRALGPLREFIPAQPELLDNLDLDSFMRASLGTYEMARFVPSRKQVEVAREKRMQREIAIKQAGQAGPEERAQNAVTEAQAKQEAGQGTGSYVAVGG